MSFVDGLKFINRREDYIAMRDLSDELCRTYGLSVVKTNGRGKNYAEWNAERNGAPTIRGQIRADIDCAIQASTTEQGFIRTMQKMGYEMRIGGNRKYPSLKPHGAKGCFRFHKLGEGYSYDEIIDRVYQNRRKVPLTEREKVRHTVRMHGSVKKTKKLSGFRARYFYYCYKLNIIRRRPLSGKSFRFTDINYYVASREDKENMFFKYSELLNSFDSGATTKITIYNHKPSKQSSQLRASICARWQLCAISRLTVLIPFCP